MASPSRPPNRRPSSPEAQALFLLALLAFFVVAGLATWAERNATVLAVLDWLTMPLLQWWAGRSPSVGQLLRQAPFSTWLLIQAATVVLPLFAAGGVYLFLTADTRRRQRMARRQIMAERENAKVCGIKEAMDAKKQARRRPATSNGGSSGNGQPPGSPAVSHEQLREVFRRQPPHG